MTTIPYMRLWVGDFLSDTMHLSDAEVGQYMLILMTMWRHGGWLPNDPTTLARVARAPVAKSVMKLLTVDIANARICQKRLLAELTEAEHKTAIKKEAGRRGGLAKSLKNNNPPLANGIAKPVANSLAKGLAKGYHLLESESKRKERKIEKERKSKNGNHENGSQENDCNKAYHNYNLAAGDLGLPIARKLTKDRLKHLDARLREHGLAGWNEALENLYQMPFCCGKNERNWRADFDFLLQPKGFNRILERAYDEGRGSL